MILILGSSLVGKSLTTLRVEDLTHLLNHIQLRIQPKGEELILVADRALCTPALHLAILRQDFTQLVLKEPLVRLQKLLETRRYAPAFAYEIIPGVLPNYDLPDLMPLVQPAALTIINPRNALGQPLTDPEAKQAYQQVKATYNKSGQGQLFVLKVGARNIDWNALLR